MATAVVICGEAFYRCQCDEPLGHDGPHKCICGGSWTKEGDVLSLPDLSRVVSQPE